jgi:hypothetical protein
MTLKRRYRTDNTGIHLTDEHNTFQPVQCEWLNQCGAPAVAWLPHTVLGVVPVCSACHTQGGKL